MELRICPKCKRAFFVRKEANYVECSVCGYTLLDERCGENTQALRAE
jgi:ribosomal protein S27E